MTRIKTYYTTPGANFIQGVELAFTKIYEVRREGIQYDLYSTSPNRSYVYEQATGRIYFNNVFNEGERVYVIYKETSAVVVPVPGVCVPLVIPATTLPNAVVDIPYSVAITLEGSFPFILFNVVSPAWMAVTLDPINSRIVYLTGTPTVEANETVSFDINNCGGSEPFSGAFDVLPAPITFTVTNQSSGVITKIIPGFFTIVTGSFPISNGQSLTGVHPAFTAGYSVFIEGLVFPSTLSLVRNGVLLESIPVFADDAYTFGDQTFLSADTIQIDL